MRLRGSAVAIAIAAFAAVGAVGAPSAGAILPPGGASAEDTVRWLTDQGYHVQVNGRANGSLKNCTTTGVSGLRNANTDSSGRRLDSSTFTTVYVDIACNNTV